MGGGGCVRWERREVGGWRGVGKNVEKKTGVRVVLILFCPIYYAGLFFLFLNRGGIGW